MHVCQWPGGPEERDCGAVDVVAALGNGRGVVGWYIAARVVEAGVIALVMRHGKGESGNDTERG
jgi:hypothetical protein